MSSPPSAVATTMHHMTVEGPDTPATRALTASGIAHTIVVHGRVGSLEEAARVRGLTPGQVLKTIVVRRGSGDYLFVLVPGTREISWPRLRTVLGVNRLSMPNAAKAKDVTGYERGTITPFGAKPAPHGGPWPVIADIMITEGDGPFSIGAGAHGVSATIDGGDLVEMLNATVADVTQPIAPEAGTL